MPQVVIIDAMFLINIRPLRGTKTIKDYTSLLFNQAVVQYYQAGTSEVHLVFDKPGRRQFNPKQFNTEDTARTIQLANIHNYLTFTPDTTIPPRWQEFIDCRECKRSIVEAMGLFLLQHGRFLLRVTQKLVISGCFSGTNEDDARVVSANELVPEQSTLYHIMQKKLITEYGDMHYNHGPLGF